MKILYLIFPFLLIIYGLYTLYKNEKNVYSIILISLGLSIIAFYTLPNIQDDLQRHFDVINSYMNHPITVIFKSGYSFVYLNNLIMYLIAQTGHPELYQAVFTFVGYLVLFKFILEVCKDEKVHDQKKIIIIIIFFFLISFYKIYILAIRNYFCFIIGSYATYLLRNNRLNVKYYLLIILLLIFIHPVSLIFILYLFFIKIKNKYFKTLLTIGIFFNKAIIKCTLLFLSTDGFFYTKIYYYINQSLQEYNTNFMIYYIILAVFALLIVFFSFKYCSQTAELLFISVIIGLSFYYQFELIRRFMYLVPLFLIEPLITVLSKKSDFYKLRVEYVCYFFMFGLSVAAVLATIANTKAYGWYLIF